MHVISSRISLGEDIESGKLLLGFGSDFYRLCGEANSLTSASLTSFDLFGTSKTLLFLNFTVTRVRRSLMHSSSRSLFSLTSEFLLCRFSLLFVIDENAAASLSKLVFDLF